MRKKKNRTVGGKSVLYVGETDKEGRKERNRGRKRQKRAERKEVREEEEEVFSLLFVLVKISSSILPQQGTDSNPTLYIQHWPSNLLTALEQSRQELHSFPN